MRYDQNGRPPSPEQVRALKHLAIQVVALLPTAQDDAARVLEFAKELVEGFLADTAGTRAKTLRVVTGS